MNRGERSRQVGRATTETHRQSQWHTQAHNHQCHPARPCLHSKRGHPVSTFLSSTPSSLHSPWPGQHLKRRRASRSRRPPTSWYCTVGSSQSLVADLGALPPDPRDFQGIAPMRNGSPRNGRSGRIRTPGETHAGTAEKRAPTAGGPPRDRPVSDAPIACQAGAEKPRRPSFF